MNNKFKKLKNIILISAIALFILFLSYSCVSYSKAKYHRKYPNTTSFDYFWDLIFKH